MAYIVKMPKLGLEMSSGELSTWLVEEGGDVTEGEPIAEIESEKTTAEITAKEDGVLRRVYLSEGDSTEPGGVVAIVAGADEDISSLEADAGGAADTGGEDDADEADGSETTTAEASSSSQSGATAQKSTESKADASDVRASPRAKQLADDLGVDLTTVEGTGFQGSITEDDVEEAAESAESAAESASSDVQASPRAKQLAGDLGVDLTTVEGTGYQGAITESDVEAAAESASSEAPAAAETADEVGTADKRVFAPPSARRLARELGVDISNVSGSGKNGRITESDVRAAAEAGGEPTPAETEPVEMERPLSGMRRTIADRLGQSYRESVHVTVNRSADAEELLAAANAADDALGVDVSISDVLILAVSAALDEYPAFNATFEDGVHKLHESHNICMAVDIEEGLIAPVVRDVDSLSLTELAETRSAVTQRALSGDYTMDDLTGGTFTISNLGVLGVESFDPVINPPQVAILGVNTIRKQVVPTDDGDVAVRRVISFSLSFDHRIVDGADAARYLGSLVEHVENPWPLVIAAGGQ
ncbi:MULTISPECIES: 2-oxo acid dehydrogenase subunit E2 [Haloferax]|uniref:2-oxo acid dehydrogenase subunit E2 n=1 Tax=Haloferax marinum TaxID=2666143 RepID=A0A6A8G776_9EURY|nr:MULTISPECIES: 2-oxo acid dehydrogenase subunit E2 [Haloferax]KAB1197103.1 2-oxo acid dehydrogenase subunit E2 [Haloferax sp. CBA1150]MRW96133.1 2-oxo acid dehydrogenase subunit E2 [Haloferax marinum]